MNAVIMWLRTGSLARCVFFSLALVVMGCAGPVPASSPVTTAPGSTPPASVAPPSTSPSAPPTVTMSPTTLPPARRAIIVDHLCTDVGLIPDTWIAAVKQNTRLTYWYASHGAQVIVGMDILKQIDGMYSLSYEAAWEDFGIGGNKDAADLAPPMKFDRVTRAYLNSGETPNVIAWAWCGGLSDYNQLGKGATAGQVDDYLKAMTRLETDYPKITFVYMTAHLDGSGAGGNTNQRNEQIRAYCRANNKVLFDFADIESYDPDGTRNYMTLGGNQDCSYSGGNWADEWLAGNPASKLGYADGYDAADTNHTRILNNNLKGRAFWWLLARIAGWEGAGS